METKRVATLEWTVHQHRVEFCGRILVHLSSQPACKLGMSKGPTDTTLQADTPSNPRLVPSHLILPGNARRVDLKLNVSVFLLSCHRTGLERLPQSSRIEIEESSFEYLGPMLVATLPANKVGVYLDACLTYEWES